MAQLKDTVITGNLAVTGAQQNSGELTLISSSGDSPGLTFQRGTLSDNYNDWRIVDSGGYLLLQERGNGSSAWTTRVRFLGSDNGIYSNIDGLVTNLATSLVFKGDTSTLPATNLRIGNIYRASADISIPAESSWTGSAVTAESGSYILYNIVSSTGKWIVIGGSSGGGSTVTWEQSMSTGTQIATITIDGSATTVYAPMAGSAPTVGDGSLKLKKDSGTATAFYTANQTGDSTLQYTTATIYHASSAAAFSQGTLPTISTTKITADDITSWVTNTPTTPATIDTTKFNGGSFTQGTDSFTANTPTTIDTTKFSGGSFTRGTFSGGSFTQGADTFTTNTPTIIDTTKFSGGSFTRGAFTTNTPTSVTYSVSGGASLASPGTLICTVVAGTSATHAADSFTAANLSAGFYTSGTSASFTQGTDNFTAATHAADSFTSAKLNSGFYTAGTAASFTQGADSFTSASFSAGFYTSGTAGTAASLSYTAREIPNVTSVGTLPTLSLKSDTVVTGLSTS